MKKLIFSALGVLGVVGAALAVNQAKVGHIALCVGETPNVCDTPQANSTATFTVPQNANNTCLVTAPNGTVTCTSAIVSFAQ
jgi:hypothetical protein